MLRLSIIIPFYNVERYIAQCLDSVYQQDIPEEEYEVICVNDCSPDNSREIVEAYQKQHTNLRLIEHERNKKLGGARNTGLRAAKGKYVWFVDSDDELYPNVLKTLLTTAEENRLDILQFDYTRGKQENAASDNISEVSDGETYLFKDVTYGWHQKISGAWRQIILREFLHENKIEYIEDAMFEDTDYLLHAFLAAKRVQYVPIVGYEYQINEESVTVAPLSPIKLAWRINLVARCACYIEVAETEVAKRTLSKMISDTLSSMRYELKDLSKKQKLEYVHYLTPNISSCKPFANWRTWLAIRYGITWFV